jgi:aquaporin Z
MVFAFGKVSGAYLNPALTLGLWTARKLGTLTAALYIAVEFLGGWAAYGVYHYLVHTSVTKLTATFSWRTFTAEAIGAGIFAVVWAAAVYQNWNRTTTAAVVGLALVVGMVAASSAGYGLINPALALGVRSWNWGAYVAGPAVGAIVGVNLFAYLFATDSERNSNKSMATSATDDSMSEGFDRPMAPMLKPKAINTAKKTSSRKK